MKVIIYCYSLKSFKRIQKACQRQGISFKNETHNLPEKRWVIVTDGKPSVKDFSDSKIEIRENENFDYIV